MVKKFGFLFSIFIITLWAISVFAQEYKGPQTIKFPPGKEPRYIHGNVFEVLPQGAKIYKEGNRIIVEGNSEYVARRFLEIEKRLVKLETEQEELTREIEELKTQLKNR